MAKRQLLVIIAFAALACSTEVDDEEQKKRGAGKGTSLNTIPSGAQKQEYNTYSIYSQNPSSQSSSNPSYQSQVSNSFYPSQGNQYYTQSNVQTDSSQSYAPQPQINLLPPSTSSQFVPINFVPNSGYQSKYQIVQPKPSGNIQLAIVQQPHNFPSASVLQYPQSLFAPNPSAPIGPHQNSLLNSLSTSGQYNVPSNIPYSLGNSYLGQPSTMLLLAQPNPSLYNNLLYQNPVQGLYNYFPQNSQAKYNVPYSSSGTSEVQAPIAQNIVKEENDIGGHTSDYTTASDGSSSYKTAYATSRSSYSKH